MPDPPPPEWITVIKELGLPTVIVLVLLIGIWKGSQWFWPKLLDLGQTFVAAQVEATKKSIELQEKSIDLHEQSLALHKENTQTNQVQVELLKKIVQADQQIFRPKRRKKP